MIRFILERVEDEFRRILAQHPAAPDLVEVWHHLDELRLDRIPLGFRFAGGADWNWVIHLPPQRYRWQIEAGFRGRDFFFACEATWRRLRAQQPLQQELRHTRIEYERYLSAILRHGDEREAAELERWYRERCRAIEESLSGEPASPMMMLGVDFGAEADRTATYTYYDGERLNRRRLFEADWLAQPPQRPSPESEARGLALLMEWLSPAQRAEYEKLKHFEVRGSDTGARYRIRHGTQMNIEQLDQDGLRVCGWCFLPEGGLVAGDVMLAQKVALETDERAALKVANRIAQMSDYLFGGYVRPEMIVNFVA